MLKDIYITNLLKMYKRETLIIFALMSLLYLESLSYSLYHIRCLQELCKREDRNSLLHKNSFAQPQNLDITQKLTVQNLVPPHGVLIYQKYIITYLKKLALQKQPACSVKRCSLKFRKIHRKISVPESLFNKFAGLSLQLY